MTNLKQKTMAIVGAGLTGLSLAEMLKATPINSYILEKSKGVGGRMATRRDGELTYDHGAAYYVHSTTEPFLWHDRWIKNDRAHIWFSDKEREFGCGRMGMTSLAKDLGLEKKVFFEEKVTAIRITAGNVELDCESNKNYTADSVILTCPLPQSLDILQNSNIHFPDRLKTIPYAKALVGLFQVENLSNESIPFDFIRPQTEIFSISNNQSKGLCRSLSFTVVMSPEWSHLHFENPDEESLDLIEKELNSFLTQKIRLEKSQLKKWRYSHPLKKDSDNFIPLENGRIILSGDAFGGGSLVGATRSASSVFDYIKSVII